MLVERIDIFDFMVTLSSQEFNALKVVANFNDESIEDVLRAVIACGFNILRKGKSIKE